jgi:hypothetical protein
LFKLMWCVLIGRHCSMLANMLSIIFRTSSVT